MSGKSRITQSLTMSVHACKTTCYAGHSEHHPACCSPKRLCPLRAFLVPRNLVTDLHSLWCAACLMS